MDLFPLGFRTLGHCYETAYFTRLAKLDGDVKAVVVQVRLAGISQVCFLTNPICPQCLCHMPVRLLSEAKMVQANTSASVG
jgi:hypothetical protein